MERSYEEHEESKPFTAQKARELAEKYRSNLKVFFTAISAAAGQGRFKVEVDKITADERKGLEAIGYKVKLFDNPRESYYEIRW